MLSKLRRQISDNFLNFRGWKTSRKIIVIESDDWGSIRMPSKQVFDTLLRQDIRVNESAYNRYDSLESSRDLLELFEVLRSFQDANEQPALLTANFVMNNPDFEAMSSKSPIEYKSEPFIKTYTRYPDHANSFEVLTAGIQEQLIRPQCHGREHVNIRRWLDSLNRGAYRTRLGFQQGLFGLSPGNTNENRGYYLEALGYSKTEEKSDYQVVIKEALEQFRTIFNFSSASFIAPNYCWDEEVEFALSLNGIRHIQSGRVQIKPSVSGKKTLVRRYTGQTNTFQQVYTARNCFFEPSLRKSKPQVEVESCLKQIETAFLWRTPAIICSHRLNYIGSIVAENRDLNLKLLRMLLKNILKTWPDVEFMSSDKLGELIFETRRRKSDKVSYEILGDPKSSDNE